MRIYEFDIGERLES